MANFQKITTNKFLILTKIHGINTTFVVCLFTERTNVRSKEDLV